MSAVVGFITKVVTKVADWKVGGFGVGKLILSTAASFGLSAAAKLFQKKPQDSPKVDESRSSMVLQAVPPRRCIRGQGWYSGPLAWPPTRRSGVDQEYSHYLILLAAHECEEIGTMKFDGEEVPLDMSGEATGKFAGYVTVEKFLGTDSQAASALMQSSFPSVWTADHQLKGITYAHVRCKWKAELFPNGHPNITFQVKGRKVLDPRLSPPAEVWSRNPALHLLDYFTWTDPDLGMGLPTEEVPLEYVIAAANICDEQVALNTSPTTYQDRYTLDGDHYAGETPADLLEHFCEAMAGNYVSVSGAEFQIFAGAWQEPDDLPGDDVELTVKDIREPFSVQGKQPIATVYNGARGTYIPSDSTEPREFTPYQSADYLADDDDEERWLSVNYRFVNDGKRCQRLSKIKVEISRRPLITQLPCGPRAWALTPLSVFRVTIAPLRWESKTFRAMQVDQLVTKGLKGNPIPGCDVSVQEWDEGIFDWDETVDEQEEEELPTITQADPLPAIISQREQQPNAILNKDSSFDGGVNPLVASDAGATATVDVASTTFRTAFGDVVYDAGSVVGLNFSTKYWIYADDPFFAGGAVSYEATTDPSDLTAESGRVAFGFVTTPADGGVPIDGDGGGGGGLEYQL